MISDFFEIISEGNTFIVNCQLFIVNSANPDLPLPALLDITPRLYYTYPMKFRCIRNGEGAAHESAAEKCPA